MSSNSSRSNVGGIFGVVMWMAKDRGGENPPTSLDSDVECVRIPIISSQSQYSQSVTGEAGAQRVEHTLTLTTLAADKFWGVGALDQAQRVGCIAQVQISSVGEILLGWSENLGYDQPLRLSKVTTQSSDSVNLNCTKKWVFKSYSTTPLI